MVSTTRVVKATRGPTRPRKAQLITTTKNTRSEHLDAAGTKKRATARRTHIITNPQGQTGKAAQPDVAKTTYGKRIRIATLNTKGLKKPRQKGRDRDMDARKHH